MNKLSIYDFELDPIYLLNNHVHSVELFVVVERTLTNVANEQSSVFVVHSVCLYTESSTCIKISMLFITLEIRFIY